MPPSCDRARIEAFYCCYEPPCLIKVKHILRSSRSDVRERALVEAARILCAFLSQVLDDEVDELDLTGGGTVFGEELAEGFGHGGAFEAYQRPDEAAKALAEFGGFVDLDLVANAGVDEEPGKLIEVYLGQRLAAADVLQREVVLMLERSVAALRLND